TDGDLRLYGNYHPSLANFPAAARIGIAGFEKGSDWAVAVLADGTVVSWGESTRMAPPPDARSGVLALSRYGEVLCAHKADGTLVRWQASPGASLPITSFNLGRLIDAPLLLRDRDNQITVRVAPEGQPPTAGSIATSSRRHY